MEKWKEYSQKNQWPWKHTVHHGILCCCVCGISKGKWNLYWYFWAIKVSKWKKSRVANCLNEMQIYWGYEGTTPANCCHVGIELLEQRLCKEGSVLLIMHYYTSKLLPLDTSCNRPLESVMMKHWSKWVMDGWSGVNTAGSLQGLTVWVCFEAVGRSRALAGSKGDCTGQFRATILKRERGRLLLFQWLWESTWCAFSDELWETDYWLKVRKQ